MYIIIDTASTLGMCAERNAIANMITNGESQIDKIVAVMPDGKVGSPCGACREYMMQLDKESGKIEWQSYSKFTTNTGHRCGNGRDYC